MMTRYEKEKELIAYCGIYCRLCDYYTGKIREAAGQLLSLVKKHKELKLFAEVEKAYNFEEFVKGLKWINERLTPCVGGCRGGGGWTECPMRKCCIERGFDFCYECPDFPCQTIQKYPRLVENLRELRRIGVEEWIKRRLV
jgi:hypothetical protein